MMKEILYKRAIVIDPLAVLVLAVEHADLNKEI